MNSKKLHTTRIIISTVFFVISIYFIFFTGYINSLYFFILVVSLLIIFRFFTEIVNKEFFKLITKLSVAVLVMSIGLNMLNLSIIEENQLTNSKYGYNNFYIRALSYVGSVYNFKLMVDYSESKGNMTFTISGNDLSKLSGLRIGIPSEFNFTQLSYLKTFNENLTEGKNYSIMYIKEYDTNSLDIGKYNVDNSTSVDFLIFFSAVNETSPNGKFHFEADVRQLFTQDWNRRTMYIILGNYLCKNPCFGGENEEFTILNLENNIVEVSYPSNYYDLYNSNPTAYRLLLQDFGLNVQNKNMIRDINIKNQLGTGALISGLVILMEAAINWYTFIIFGIPIKKRKIDFKLKTLYIKNFIIKKICYNKKKSVNKIHEN